MSQIALTLKNADEQTIAQYGLESGRLEQIEAINGAYYQFTDTATGTGPVRIDTARSGDDLLLSFNGSGSTDLVIKDYFARGEGALIGFQANGEIYHYPVITAPEHLLAETLAAPSAGVATPAALGAVAAVAVVAGGIAIATHNHDKHDNHRDNAPQPHSPDTPDNTGNPPSPPNQNPGNNTNPLLPPGPNQPNPNNPNPNNPNPNNPNPNNPNPNNPNPNNPNPNNPNPNNPNPNNPNPNNPNPNNPNPNNPNPNNPNPNNPNPNNPNPNNPNPNNPNPNNPNPNNPNPNNPNPNNPNPNNPNPNNPNPNNPNPNNPNPNNPQPAPNKAGTVTIQGEAKVGSELTAKVDDADGVDTSKVKYQWQRDGVDIKDATGSSYKLGAADVGHKITVKASYTDNANHNEALTSTATDSVTDGTTPPPNPNPQPNHAGTVTISGDTKVGETLTAKVDDADGVPNNVQYQWLANGVAIAGATGSSYQLTAAEAGKTITVRATYTDNAQHSEAPTSAATNPVVDPANPNPNPNPQPQPQPNHEGSVTISGDAKVGETLTAKVDDADGVPNNVQYQWLANGVAIAGATGSSYQLTAAEAGKTITVRATYTDNVQHSEAPISTATAPVVDPANPNPQPPQPPANHEGKVSITGDAKVGETLTATVTDDDGVPANVSYQWLANGVAIAGATDSSYQLTAAEAGKTISVRATYTDNAQYSEAPTSAATTPVVDPANPNPQPPQPPANHEGTITISGDAKVGETLTAKVDDADGVPNNVQYQWLANGVAIAGATGSSYQLTAAEAGKTISVRATYTDNAQHSESPISTATAPVVDPANPNPQPPQPPANHAGTITISGDAKVGETLTAKVDDADGVPNNVQYQWLANGVAIAGATGSSYQLTAAEAGKTISVRATYTDNAQHSEAPTSATTSAVVDPANPNPNPNPQPPQPPANHEGTITISGDAKVGETLTAKVDDADGVPNNVQYQWLANGVAIAGATGSSYQLTATEVGKTISVRATYTDNAQHSEAPTSATTSAVVDPANPNPNPNPQPPQPPANHEGTITISGDAKVGETLTAKVDDADGVPNNVQYQWLANGVAIAGATGSSYQLTATEVGKTISVRATYTDNAQHSEAPISTATAPVVDPANPNPNPNPQPQPNHAGTVAISGDAKVGETLTAEVHDADNFDESKVSYQWLREGKEIAGANGKTYTLTADDEGHKITVKASYTDNAGHKESHDAESSVVQPQTSTNHAPTDITLSAAKVMEGKDGAEVGKLTTTDPDAGDTHTYKVSDSRFEVSADGTLKLKAGQHLDFATEKTVTLQVTTDDGHGGTYNKTFTLQVQDDPNYPPVNPPQTNHEGDVSISGNAKVGETLTAEVHDADNFDESKVSYQWLREGKEIAGANGKTYTLTADDEGHKVSVKAEYTDNAGNKESHDAESSVVQPKDNTDQQPPELKITAESYELTEGAQTKLTFKLSEPVTGFDESDLQVTNGTISGFQKISDTEYTATFTAGAAGQGNAAVSVAAGAFTDLQGNPLEYASSAVFALSTPQDSIPPSLLEIRGEQDLQAGKTVEQIFVFSEPVKDFTVDDIEYTGGKISGFEKISDTEYRVRFTPDPVPAGQADADAYLHVGKGQFSDNAGNINTAGFMKGMTVHPDAVPQNHTGTVAISGEAKVGEILTAKVTDDDGFDSAKVKYQWLRDDQPIDGATGDTYKLTADDAGHKITVKAEYQDGAQHAESPVSTATEVPQDAPNHAGTVAISGEAKVGEILTAKVTDDDGFDSAKVKYQWLRDDQPIDGATGDTYKLTADDAGHKIAVKAEYQDGAQHAESPVSTATEVPQDAPNHSGTVAISGEAKVGEILTAKVTDDDGFDSAKVKYQWLRDDQPIDGATGDTYKLTADDAGHKITVKAEYQDGAQHAENPVSAATVVPQDAPNHTPTGTVTISGLAQAGSTLHAGNTLADEDGMGEVKYQWLRDGKAIDGATGSAYTLTAEDVGHGISVKASYTDQKAHDESKDSLSSLKPAADGTALTFEDNHGQREFDWAGFKWTARDSDSSKGAPTASGEWARDNARVDGTNLDLTITNPSGNTPIASEIVSTRAMGYGSYEATFHTDFTKLDPYSVFGFFTYQWNTPSVAGNHEIDAIELSHWGETVPRAPTTYYTDANQRIKAGGEVSYAWPETVGHATVQMEWRPDKITWTFRNADTGEVMREVSSTIDIPTSDKQQMHFNLWTYEPGDDPNGKKEGWRDSAKDGATQKVTLESFNYTPLKGDGGETPPPSGENHKGSVTLSGEAKIGHTLTAHVSDADGVPDSGITWRWYGDDKLLPGVEGQTITLTEAVKGMQLRAEAQYTDKVGHAEKPISDLSSAVVPEVAHDSGLIPPPAADAPRVTLSGVTSVKEGSQATYTVSLDKAASEDVSVDVHIKHNSTDNSDANLTWNSQRIVIPKGETSKNFTVDTHNDGKAESAETYTVEIANALVGNVYAGGTPPGSSVTAQSMIIPAYKYPTGAWEKDTYWDSVHKAGGGKVPYVIVNPASGAGKTVDPNYAKLIDDNVAAGIKNIGYIRTNYQTRPIEEVKAEVDKYLELYGKDKIHGYFFDEISTLNNHATAYMAEIYRYVKAKAGDKLVMANPGAYITDAIAPYADIFVTSEVSAKTYLNNYEQPKSAFENDPKNANRIMHMIHDVTPDQYDAVIRASRERNAGWVFPTSDTQENPLPEAERDKHPEQDGNPYNALPQNFDQLVADVNNLGQQPADPAAPRTDSKLTAANIDNNNVTTEIVDANSAPLEQHEPQLQSADSVAASATDGLDAHATHHTHGGDGDDVLIGDGIDAAAYSQLVSHSGEDLLQYLGQHSAELLAASQHSANHELHGGAGDDVLIAGYGAQLLEGGTGADTFAYLLDSHDAASWNAPSHISDFDPTEGDRIVLAGGSNLNVSIAYHGEHCSCGCCGGGSSENDTYQLRVSDDNGHTRTIDVSMSNHKPHSAADILAHVEIRAPQGYEPSPYSAAQPQHQLQDEHTPLI